MNNNYKKPLFIVKTCASSANLGPGFDILGLALKIYDCYYVYYSNDGNYHINYSGKIEEKLARDEKNLVIKTLKKVLQKYHKKISSSKKISEIEIPLKIDVEIKIPMGKGLGSSAAAISAGLLIANKLYNLKLGKEELLNIGGEFEGHPDNLAASLYGGLVVCYKEKNKYRVKKINLRENYIILLIIPDNHINTKNARKLLPQKIPLEACVYNIRNTLLLVDSLRIGDLENALAFIDDKIHQPYRKEIYLTSFKLVKKMINKYGIPAAISGAGPTVIGILNETFINKYKNFLKNLQRFSEIKYCYTSICKRGSFYSS